MCAADRGILVPARPTLCGPCTNSGSGCPARSVFPMVVENTMSSSHHFCPAALHHPRGLRWHRCIGGRVATRKRLAERRTRRSVDLVQVAGLPSAQPLVRVRACAHKAPPSGQTGGLQTVSTDSGARAYRTVLPTVPDRVAQRVPVGSSGRPALTNADITLRRGRLRRRSAGYRA
jgi:hypothetical protein